MSLVQFCKQCVDAAGLVETPEKRAAPPLPDEGMDGNIEGKVLWLSSQRGWMVVYTNQKGVRTTKSGAEFRVPSAHPTGVSLTPQEFRTMRRDIFQKSMNTWNDLDKSLAPRLEP